MDDGSAGGRPLDDGERRALQGIERELRDDDPEFPERLLSPPGMWHPPIRETGTALRPSIVLGVLGGALAFAALLYVALPEGALIAVVLVTLFGLLPAACLLWAHRSGEF